MKKCSSCGLENPDDAVQCRQCEQPFATPVSNPAPRPAAGRSFLPYFLSYFVVTSAVFLYDFVVGQRTGVPAPPHYVILNTSIPVNELVTRLEQVGVPKNALLGGLAPDPAVVPALLHHFALFAAVLFAFWVLAKVFKKIFSK